MAKLVYVKTLEGAEDLEEGFEDDFDLDRGILPKDPKAKEIEKERCEVCNKSQFKYKCPGCTTKTCSLNCSKQHKIDFKCDGK